ncbi:MAG: Re/Si-specific NAD(P)(+) transhydrogenase subunit alpha [Proteobacteria bacterium]|nr:Re/Si-specific NAD(P)(+) transhydrogenase subunit alpha [Pseudomonadota bacterium]
MRIAITRERREYERRVACSPDTIRKFKGLGFDVVVEAGAGNGAAMCDEDFAAAGADIAADAAAALANADIVLKVQRPLLAGEGSLDEMALIKQGAIVIGMLGGWQHKDQIAAYVRARVTAFSLEMLPRITRAQSMDVLSSQSNLAGYKAVLDGAAEFGRAFPMMMTAAGTIAPARVIVLGAGVAGLQAIATARRLGAVVTAYDVRPAVKEQVESLGGKFLDVDEGAPADAETAGGYAKEMGEDYRKKQEAALRESLKKQDIAICTALIPGRPAPELISAEMVAEMKQGSVIVDLAVEQGGNCPLSEYGKVVEKHGVRIVGHANVPSRLAVDATAMYAKNLLNFVTLLADGERGAMEIDWTDEIVQGCLLTRDGAPVQRDRENVPPAPAGRQPAAKREAA